MVLTYFGSRNIGRSSQLRMTAMPPMPAIHVNAIATRKRTLVEAVLVEIAGRDVMRFESLNVCCDVPIVDLPQFRTGLFEPTL